MAHSFSQSELLTLSQIQQTVNIEALGKQLKSVISSNDPIGYMETNLNWEIDTDELDNDQIKSLDFIEAFAPAEGPNAKFAYIAWHPFRNFIDWFKRKKLGQKIKKILCSITDKIRELIDEEAELKKIIEVALIAIAAALGVAAINPVLLTILVGLLAAMILKGVDQVCAI